MAGHSKWANIKHRKGAVDAKRGKIFTKIAREITIAARLGGGDPAANPRLRLAIEKGRGVNMPNDNIKRAILKGTGEGDGGQLEEMVLEGYGPGGTAFLVECVSDNRNRAVADVRATFNKNGGSIAEAGAVAWNFSRKTVISIVKGAHSDEDVLMAVIDAGAEDVRTTDESYDVYGPIEVFDTLRAALETAGFTITGMSLEYVANQTLELSGADAIAALKLYDLLEDVDDAQNVYTNLEVSDEVLANL
ncbi:MAG TPA: YebC/PmpR family DNA-binding transcriptional regulator [Candidatus Kapabacteria bacterium]|jgi:YebC/PmpR family DNA-binding regulatory protein|nr:YebC/PmpR family DNA-binding transcriptional regulator [Candidatus Kapabacteria bacterium]